MCRALELTKAYDDELTSVALHPGGLFALVGFADKLRLLAILVDDFRYELDGSGQCQTEISGGESRNGIS